MTQAVSAAPSAKRQKIVHDRPPMLAIGVMIWLGSELMFFSGLFAALFTIRAHLASWPPAGTELEVLLAAADTALYQAKRNGRNRVEAAEELPLSLENWRRKTAGATRQPQQRPGVPGLA